MMKLAYTSKLFILELVDSKANGLTRQELNDWLTKHPEFEIATGRGATNDDFIRKMIKEDVLIEQKNGKLKLTPIGENMLLDSEKRNAWFYKAITRTFLQYS